MNQASKSDTPDLTRPSCLMQIADATPQMDAVMEGIMWSRLTRMRAALQQILAQPEHGAMARSIHHMYQSMAPERQARVLLSSEFCEQYLCLDLALRGRDGSGRDRMELDEEWARALGALHDIVSREHALSELSHGRANRYLQESRLWVLYSPMGDLLAEKAPTGDWSLRSLPMLGECVALDLDSHVARHHELRSGVLSQPCLPFTDVERAHVHDKLSQALEAIDYAEPAYGQLVRTFVRRIVVRKSDEIGVDESRRYGSEHVPRQPGSLRLLNTHHPGLTMEACMESIMHESTHNFLAAWELANGFFVANDYKYRVVSPWTGNQIPNSSYIHAVFVYYICHRLMRSHLASAEDLSGAANTYVQRRLSVCAAGFLIEQRLSARMMTSSPINRDIGEMMDRMQVEMKRQYAYGAWK